MPDFGIVFWLLALAVFGAGAIRGFAGFGDALFFLPIAGILLPPIDAIMVFMLVAVFGPLPLVPQALKTARRDLLIPLTLAMALCTPIGFYILTQLSPDSFRFGLSIMAIGVVLLMVIGLHPKFTITPQSAAILGISCGVIGGFTGVPGSILIFVLLNSQLKSGQTRALSLISLLAFDFVMLASGLWNGNVTIKLAALALFLLPLYVLGSWFGRHIFNPDHEKRFRAVAFSLILTSGILGLPFFANLHP